MPILESQPIRKHRYSNILDLQLKGFQISLSSRPNPKSGKVISKLSPRINKVRPKRPMSAIPAIGYQGSENSKTMPSWSRPQSAGCTRRNKLAAKFPSQDVQESGYNSELGATYTLSSSQMLQSLIGSCSLNTGLDSDSSHTPSPQPSLGETIRAATHLEPGLVSKPPLPPTQDLKTKESENLDDIIAFKFQRWFPDSVVNTDTTKSLLDLRPYESKYNNDEITDESDIGSRISLTDGEISDRDYSKYTHKDNQTGKMKKQKSRSSSPIKRENGSKSVKSSLKVKDMVKFSGIKTPSVVVTEEDSQAKVGLGVTNTIVDYRLNLETSKSKQVNEVKDEVNSNYSIEGSFYKCNTDNLSLKSYGSGPGSKVSNHSPPIKLKAENGEEMSYKEDYPKVLLELDEKISDLDQTAKEYSEKTTNGKNRGRKEEKNVYEDNLFSPLERNESIQNTSQVLKDFGRNNFKSLSVETNIPLDFSVNHNERMNKDRTLATDGQMEKVNWNCGNVEKNEASSSLAGNSVKLGRSGSVHKLFRSASCDSKMTLEVPEGVGGASYEDIVSILKVLETEDLEPPLLKTGSAVPSTAKTMPPASSSARAILNFLDEVDRSSTVETIALPDTTESVNAAVSSSRFGELLNMKSADLAQTVMKLTLQLEEINASNEALSNKHKHTLALMKQQKEQEEATVKRNQKFIDQILNEKRQLAEQCEKIIKEMDEKHLNNIRNMEERHKVEMRKAQEKFTTAEKSRRDRWIDLKTKKIKEMTVKGLEPELDRMTTIHQEEIAELRRVHQKQLDDLETTWSRRLATRREEDLADKEKAIAHEREATRHRLKMEVAELEKSYQEQRKHMLDEVRQEREAMERDVQTMMENKQRELDKEWQKMQQKLQDKMKEEESKHQEELKNLRDSLESEKEAWKTKQNAELLEKEAVIRQELKRERDRHIEMIIRKLETEATAKEQAIDNKIKRLKETYESEIQELENSLKDLKHRLKEARSEVQKYEENNCKTAADLHQVQAECTRLKQTCDQLQQEKHSVTSQNDSKILALQQELTNMAMSLQQEVSAVHEEKERQLQQVYTRVKEAITKKDEAVLIIQKQRDAALEQCCHLEKLLEQQRKNIIQLKSEKEQI